MLLRALHSAFAYTVAFTLPMTPEGALLWPCVPQMEMLRLRTVRRIVRGHRDRTHFCLSQVPRSLLGWRPEILLHALARKAASLTWPGEGTEGFLEERIFFVF